MIWQPDTAAQWLLEFEQRYAGTRWERRERYLRRWTIRWCRLLAATRLRTR